MKKPAKQQSKTLLKPLDVKVRQLVMYGVVLALAVGIIFQTARLENYKTLAQYPNQACRGIGVALENGMDLKHYNFEASSAVDSLGPKNARGLHTCNIGTVITQSQRNADGSGSSTGYVLGATVMYFKTAAAAYAYADGTENKMLSWSVDEAGAHGGFKQDKSLFTYIHTDVSEPYVEAYTVRDKALIRFSLPCAMTDSNKDASFDACNKMAQKVLSQFATTVQQKLSTTPLDR